MGTFSSSEARNRLGELLDRVAQGETIRITRHGKTVARMVPDADRSLEEVRQAVDNIRKLRDEIARRPGFKPLTDQEIRAAINEGRH